MTHDICIRKHHNNPNSYLANRKVDKINDREIILEYLSNHETGTLKELARFMNKEKNEISGRFTELKASEVIEETGERREGCSVYQLKTYGTQLRLF